MTQGRLLVRTGRVFDDLENRWVRLSTQKNVATILVTVFVFGLVLVEFKRQGWLPAWFEDQIPTNHFVALLFPFTLLLLTEMISLVFALAQSVAIAVGKQLAIMSLILIRQSFEELTYFDEPIVWGEMSSGITTRVLYIVSDALGALVIFGLLAL